MLNANADKCAIAYQLKQSDPKRKNCENAVKVVAQLTNRLGRRVPALDGIGVAVGGVVTDRAVVESAWRVGSGEGVFVPRE